LTLPVLENSIVPRQMDSTPSLVIVRTAGSLGIRFSLRASTTLSVLTCSSSLWRAGGFAALLSCLLEKFQSEVLGHMVTVANGLGFGNGTEV
jgi:hypothetical protein